MADNDRWNRGESDRRDDWRSGEGERQDYWGAEWNDRDDSRRGYGAGYQGQGGGGDFGPGAVGRGYGGYGGARSDREAGGGFGQGRGGDLRGGYGGDRGERFERDANTGYSAGDRYGGYRDRGGGRDYRGQGYAGSDYRGQGYGGQGGRTRFDRDGSYSSEPGYHNPRYQEYAGGWEGDDLPRPERYGRGFEQRFGAGYGGGRDDYRGEDRSRRDEGQPRGFLRQAADEISSWFGSEDAWRRRQGEKAGEHRGKGPKGYRRSDDRIQEEVSDRLSDDSWLDASSIEVSVSDGEVTLNGTVGQRADKKRAEHLAETIAGVDNVQNNLRIEKNDYAAAGRSQAGSTYTGQTGTGYETPGDKAAGVSKGGVTPSMPNNGAVGNA